METKRDHQNQMKTVLGFVLLLALVQTGTEAQSICVVPPFVNFNENNTAGAVVTTFTADPGVTMVIETPNVPFIMEETNLVATETLDYDSGKLSYSFKIKCNGPEASKTVDFSVLLVNLNDEAPKFSQNNYLLNVPELTAVGEVVGTYAATDPDNLGPLLYTLTPASGLFKLKSQTVPEIVVAEPLDYDKLKNVPLTLTLMVQDTDPATPSHTDTTTIDITITDVDNRPPWFQPCTETEVGGVKICPTMGYTGAVNIGEQEIGALPLKPGPIQAIDGDNGLNYPVRYSIISGGEGLFEINPDTGNITMLKACDASAPIHMIVMASQVTNSYQLATTTLVINVVIKSLHKPQFERPQYEAVVQGVGRMAMEAADKNKALKILATDQDYAAAGGINPNIVYSIVGNTDFSIIDGFLFMVNDVAGGSYNLQVQAEDVANFETVTAGLTVEVIPEPTTTPPPTTITTPTAELTSDPTTGLTTAPTTNPTSDPTTVPTTNPTSDPSESVMTTPGTTDQTSRPTPTTEGTTGSTAHTVSEITPGGFTSTDMAALGATLGCLLFISIVAIVVLTVQVRKGNTDWKKINEASVFRSSLGPSGQKEGVQFTNEAFQHDDDDDDKNNKGGPSGGVPNGKARFSPETDKPQPRSIPRPPSPLPEDTNEKDVKPILTKEKSREDGYKAVWFKEDIDPNAKEDVVIIPDSRADEEDEDEEEEERKIPKVKFNDADVDSGLGDKMEDSEEERVMTSNL